MSEPKFTPGPWHVVNNKQWKRVRLYERAVRVRARMLRRGIGWVTNGAKLPRGSSGIADLRALMVRP